MSRSSMLHKSGLGLFGAAGIVLAAASLAFACSAAPSVTFRGGQAAASSSAGPAGSTVSLEGSEWAAGPVDIRWNSAAGERLAQPSGPSFSVDVTIPQAQPGVYTIYLSQPAPTDTARDAYTVARASFEVTPSASNAGGGGSSETTRTGQSSSSTSGEDAQQSTTAPSGSVVPGAGGAQSFATPSGSEDTSQATAQPASTGRTRTGAASSTARAQNPAAASVDGSTSAGAQAVFAGSLATAAPAVPAEDQAKTAAANTVSGDLYSGFNASGDASLLPSLADSARSSSGPAGQAALGIALFGTSLVALFGGYAVAELRRRKVSSQTS